MARSTYGAVTIEHEGAEGTVTVSRWRWFSHPGWFWLGIAGLVAIAVAMVAVELSETLHTVLALGVPLVGIVVILSLPAALTTLVGRGIVTQVGKLEVRVERGASPAGYREASTPSRLVLRAPHRVVPLERVKHVTRTRRYVQPKDGDSYWVYRVYVVLDDEALDLASFPRAEGTADACAKAVARLLGAVPIRESDDPKVGFQAAFVGALTGGVVVVGLLMVSLGGGSELFGARWIGMAAIIALLVVLRFGVFPFVAALMRKAHAGRFGRTFRMSVAPQSIPARVVAPFAASMLAILAGAGVLATRGAGLASARAEAKTERAAAEARHVASWEWGHDSLPHPIELNGDGVEDYIGAFESREKNGATVVAAFDGKTHETIWRAPPLMMNVGHNHFTLVGDQVLLLEVKKPARLIDAATGKERGAFPSDPLWAGLNPSRICPDGDRVVMFGHMRGEVTLALDLASRSVEPIDPVGWCHFRQPPSAARRIERAPSSNVIAVGDYQLVLGSTAQLYRSGKLIKQFPFTDVQDGAMCGAPDEAKVWVPVAAGGGAMIDLAAATTSPAARPSWCPEDALPPEGEPFLPAEGPDGMVLATVGLVSEGRVFAMGGSDGTDHLVAFEQLGRAFAWKRPFVAKTNISWDAAHGRLVVAFANDGGIAVHAFSADRGEPLFEVALSESGRSAPHGIRVGRDHVFVAYDKRLEVLDAKTGRSLHRHGD